MTKQILVTGGTGFIGSHLVDLWLAQGHQVSLLTQNPLKAKKKWGNQVSICTEHKQLNQSYHWLINLAGAGIFDSPWSQKRKQLLRDSRIGLTEQLVDWVKRQGQHFELVISGSAIGYYGLYPNAGTRLDEQSEAGCDFAATLCQDWEKAANQFTPITNRLILVRTGIVLGADGGILKRLWLPFSFGLGGRLGSGEQVLSWIHLKDYCRAILYLSQSNLSGPINMTAPNPVTNKEFTTHLAKTLKRPAFFSVPSWAIKGLGEMSSLLLKGQYALPQTLQQNGFSFDFEKILPALKEIKQSWP